MLIQTQGLIPRPGLCSLKSGLCHVICLSSKDLSCQDSSGFHQPQWVQEPLLHIPVPALPGNPSERWLGDSSLVAVFLKSSFRNFQVRWNVLTGFSMAITPILRNPCNLPKSQADTQSLWAVGTSERIEKATFFFYPETFSSDYNFSQKQLTSWGKYNIAD